MWLIVFFFCLRTISIKGGVYGIARSWCTRLFNANNTFYGNIDSWHGARLFKRVNRPLERGLPPAREKMLDLPVRTRRRLTGQYRERFPRFIFTVNYKIFLQFMRHPVGDLPWHIYTVTKYKWRHVWNIFNAALFMTWFHPFYTQPSHFLP